MAVSNKVSECMRRKLFTLASVLFLILCVATTVMCAWTYQRWQSLGVQVSSRYFTFNLVNGLLVVVESPVNPDGLKMSWRSGTGEDSNQYLYTEADGHRLPGFAWGLEGPSHGINGEINWYRWFGMRLAMWVPLELVLPWMWIARHRKRVTGHCGVLRV